ncbi:MAG: Panacea domain-containing protein [Brevinema sp.]
MFNEKKATALARQFLSKTETKKMLYMKLIKLMYIADRKMLEQNEAPFTNDTYVTMANGMMLSNVYNLIRCHSAECGIEESEEKNYWKTYIETLAKDYMVALTEYSPENIVEMNDEELKVIDDVWKQYGAKEQWDLVELLHTEALFPEWKDPYPYGINTVSIYELLSYMGKSPEDVSTILDKIDG